ncbi:MAG: 3-dehydroquinate synthase [Actinomycetota bacterium]|jgi:3-dehydroquinate synthase
MNHITVRAEHEYTVHIGAHFEGVLTDIAKSHNKVLFVAPQYIFEHYHLESVLNVIENATFFALPDGEHQKDISVVEKLWQTMGETGLTRSDALVAIGGGATTDLGGFAAATWLRGIAWYAIPTTLAAMVDASVGGKTGINSPAGKNLIGSFHSPMAVHVDLRFLDSLSHRDFAAGLAEVIKVGFISDESILTLLEEKNSIELARGVAEELICKSVLVKATVVSQDFQESKLREILNYGHTLGHAIEKYSHFEMRHGEAVAIGLVFAAQLSANIAGLKEEVVERHRSILSQFGLPTSTTIDFDALVALMRSDKKSRGNSLRFIGLNSIGNPHWLEDVSIDDLRNAYERMSL